MKSVVTAVAHTVGQITIFIQTLGGFLPIPNLDINSTIPPYVYPGALVKSSINPKIPTKIQLVGKR